MLDGIYYPDFYSSPADDFTGLTDDEIRRRLIAEGRYSPQLFVDGVYYPEAHTDNPLDRMQYGPTVYLQAAIASWIDDPMTVVAADTFLFYDRHNRSARVGPDVFVIPGIPQEPPQRSYYLWQEGHYPTLVIEILSRRTHARDLTFKRALYESWGVTEYIVCDPNQDLPSPLLLPQLSAHPAAARVTVIWQEEFPYPNMSRALNNVVAVWQAGATPQQAAAAYSPVVYGDKIYVIIAVADVATFNRIEAFFTTNGVFIAPELRDKYLEAQGMYALVPVPMLVELSQVAGIMEISDFGEPPVPAGESISRDDQALINANPYRVLSPNLRSRLSPLPTEVWAWELEGITPTPAPAPSSGRISGDRRSRTVPGGLC